MSVPFVDFSQQYDAIKDAIDAGFKDVFTKSSFIGGPQVAQFEESFSTYCGCKYGVGVNSGTDALYLAMAALDVGPGDEVILPAMTFIATALCVSYTGAKVVLCDIEDRTYNLDPEKLEALITDNTKAIIPVHLYGQTPDMDEIRAIADKHNVAVVEDAAQAHGSSYKNNKVGSLGNIACFSFYPTKALGGAGDGGMVVTDREDIAKKCRMLRDYGREGRYDHKVKGYNSRLDTLQAVVLEEKLKHLDTWNSMRGDVAKIYQELLTGVDGIIIPQHLEDRGHVYQTYALRVPERRDEILEKLKEQGIGVLIHYPIPIHLQGAYQDLGYKQGDFPVSEMVAGDELSLPMFPHMTRSQVEEVVEALKKALG